MTYCKRCGALTHYEADCVTHWSEFKKQPPKKAKAKKTKGKKK